MRKSLLLVVSCFLALSGAVAVATPAMAAVTTSPLGAVKTGDVSSATITLGATGVSAGQLVVVNASAASLDTLSVSDSGGNTWTSIPVPVNNSNGQGVVFYTVATHPIAPNTGTITVSGPANVAYEAQAFVASSPNGWLPSPLDQSANGGWVSASSPQSTPLVSPAQADELVIGAYDTNSQTSTMTPGSGFTSQGTVNNTELNGHSLFTEAEETYSTTGAVATLTQSATGATSLFQVATFMTGGSPASPLNTTPPVVSGADTQGDTLTTTTGTWTGDPSGYSYQWQACAGGTCSNIPGATSSSYALQASDVGDTVDVVVTATNPEGSTSAMSAQTGTIQGQAALPYFNADPNVTGNLSPWGYFAAPPTYSDPDASVAQHPDGATASGGGSVGVVNDPLGSQGKVYQEVATPASHDGTGASSGDWAYLYNTTGQTPNYGHNGDEDWIHYRVMIPQGAYTVTPGEWNTTLDSHPDSSFAACNTAELTASIIQYTGDPYPYWGFRVQGGVASQCATDTNWTYLNSNQLQYNHWYDFLIHVVWSPDPSIGYVQLWLDGTKYIDQHESTLWQTTGGVDDVSEFELDDYQQRDGQTSTVYYSHAEIGPTQASVSFP